MTSPSKCFGPAICVIGFHHSRFLRSTYLLLISGSGPEVESWFGIPQGVDPSIDNDWSYLPFMALSDGAHSFEEDFSYFVLKENHRQLGTKTSPSTRPSPVLPSQTRSLFGMSCTRQLDAKELIERPDDVTRSTVQKSIVIVTEKPWMFPTWREQLSLVTRAWFLQRDFRDVELLKEFQESLRSSEQDTLTVREQFLGLSLREFVYEFKHQALVLFKCALLQPKMLFFGSRCERLCMLQFTIISLIPGLLRNLQDCADPELDNYENELQPPSSLRTSDRNSLLVYMGLPLQIFGKGALFGPYTPLQQLDVLLDKNTKSYIIGSTNSLLLQQKDRYSDIVINLDDISVTITSPTLKTALALTAADRRWVDFIHQKITSTWDPSNPSRPTTHGYAGSEEFIRLQFEEYLLALLSATKYHHYLHDTPAHKRDLSAFPEIEGDPTLDFGDVWLEAWKASPNYRLWHRNTDSHLFDIVDPRHPTAGSLSLEDINRRVAQQLEELHLEERFNTGKEALNRHLSSGKKQVSEALSSAWSNFEAYRAAHQRAKSPAPADTARANRASVLSPPATASLPLEKSENTPSILSPASTATQTPTSATALIDPLVARLRPEINSAHTAVGAASQKAGAYISSWSNWASEKRKGWASGAGTPTTPGHPELSSKDEKGDTRSPRKLMIVERMRHQDSAEPRSAPVVSHYNPFARMTLHRSSILSSNSNQSENSISNMVLHSKTDTDSSGDVLYSADLSSPSHNQSQTNLPTQMVPTSPARRTSSFGAENASEPRSPGTKRGIGKGKRREEKGSDGIGRLDA